jgi:hypothetical protein
MLMLVTAANRVVHSGTKGLAAMTLAIAHSRGWLDYAERRLSVEGLNPRSNISRTHTASSPAEDASWGCDRRHWISWPRQRFRRRGASMTNASRAKCSSPSAS